MELTMKVEFGHILHLLGQMPAKQIAKIKNEFPETYIVEKATAEVSDFQKFILDGPVMSDEQYSNFTTQRQHLDLWRAH